MKSRKEVKNMGTRTATWPNAQPPPKGVVILVYLGLEYSLHNTNLRSVHRQSLTGNWKYRRQRRLKYSFHGRKADGSIDLISGLSARHNPNLDPVLT